MFYCHDWSDDKWNALIPFSDIGVCCYAFSSFQHWFFTYWFIPFLRVRKSDVSFIFILLYSALINRKNSEGYFKVASIKFILPNQSSRAL